MDKARLCNVCGILTM